MSGRENPGNIILSSRLCESQSRLVLTSHVLSAGIMVAKDANLRRFSGPKRDAYYRIIEFIMWLSFASAPRARYLTGSVAGLEPAARRRALPVYFNRGSLQ